MLLSLDHLENQNASGRGFRIIVSNNGHSGQLQSLETAYSRSGAAVLRHREKLNATYYFIKIQGAAKTTWVIFVGCRDAASLDALDPFLEVADRETGCTVIGGRLVVNAFGSVSHKHHRGFELFVS